MPVATADKKQGNKPVFKDGEFAVFLNTRNKTSGETFEVFTIVQGQGADALRVDVDAEIAGYKLQNSMGGREKFSDVIDLFTRGQILVDAPKREGGGTYPLIIAALPVVEKPGDTPAKVFRRLPLVTAAPIWDKEDREPDRSVKQGSEPIGFKLKSRTAENKLSEKFDLSCFCTTTAKDVGRVVITVADAIAARDALASGKKHSFERDGIRVTGDAIEPVQKSTTGLKTFKWALEPVRQNAAALPGYRSGPNRGTAR